MYFLFDIGASKTRVAISPDGHQIDPVQSYKTPRNFKSGMAKMRDAARGLSGGRKIQYACGGVAGLLNPKKAALLRRTNLSAWAGKPLRQSLEAACMTKVLLENDAALAGLGEGVQRAARG